MSAAPVESLVRRVAKTAQAYVVARRAKRQHEEMALYRRLSELVEEAGEMPGRCSDLEIEIAIAAGAYVIARRNGLTMIDAAAARYATLEGLCERALRLTRPPPPLPDVEPATPWWMRD